MIPDEAPIAPVGHNSGTSLMQIAQSEQEAALEPYETRRAQLLTSASRQVVRDRQSAADAADTMKIAAALWKRIDEDRQQRTEPYRQVHSALIAMVAEFWAPVQDAMDLLLGQIDAWNVEEDKRIAEQQAEQDRQMAALRARANPAPVVEVEQPQPSAPEPEGREYIDYTAPSAPAPRAPIVGTPARRARIVGDLGGTISRDQVKIYEIEDIKSVPAWVFETETVKNAILTVARSNAKHMPNIPGIKVSTAPKTNVR